MQSTNDILSFILEALKREMPATVVKTWFDDMNIETIAENTITLTTTADFKRTIIKERYLKIIENAVYELFGSGMEVIIDIFGEEENGNTGEEDEESFSETKDTYNFDNFVVGESNKFAAAAARAVAESPGIIYNPLFIYGGSGLGKTHLLYAIMNFIRAKNKNAFIRLFSAELFTNELANALRNKEMPFFHEKYRKSDLLLVDDIQFIGGRNFSQEEFFHTFNTLYDKNRQIVLTSDRPPKDVPALEERLRTRFESGLIVDMQPPDFETRMAIIKSKALRLKMLLNDDVIIYLASTLTLNVRQLEGAVKHIAAWHDLVNAGGLVDIDAAKRAVEDMQKNNPALNPTPEMIVAAVASFYNIEEKDIYGKSRNAEIVMARQTSMYIIRDLLNKSLKEIGEKIFRRDHTTVMHSIDKIESLRKNDPVVEKDINMIIENIRGG